MSLHALQTALALLPHQAQGTGGPTPDQRRCPGGPAPALLRQWSGLAPVQARQVSERAGKGWFPRETREKAPVGGLVYSTQPNGTTTVREVGRGSLMWAGFAMMTVVAGVLAYLGWWTKAAIAVAVGVGMVVLAEALPGHGAIILVAGLGVFALAALLVVYAYYKGQLDQNGIPDFLERSAKPAPPAPASKS